MYTKLFSMNNEKKRLAFYLEWYKYRMMATLNI